MKPIIRAPVQVAVAEGFGCWTTKSTRFPLGKSLKRRGPTEVNDSKTQRATE